ncbi:ABC transporter substrate-binding protein [Microbacterium sp. BK668]|uniref:ABC transporter substrate-binding protein n=1 Tax=Microbacterium sp. BK668 TaxID=2512118 RepID=UPI001414FF13|nr:ABC transporter substrate-binding protein [Microbacterium sp. BK668]
MAPTADGLADVGECETITVLTNRTDIVDTDFKEYAEEFEKQNPGHSVKFEAVKNYDDDVRTRMNTKDYGDVLLIPASVTPDQFPSFFAPLGEQADLAEEYYFTPSGSFEGQTYGLSQTGNATGYIVNKKVWAEAGITEPPADPEKFLAALEKIKDETGAVPLYTNYKDGWPLSAWSSQYIGIVSGEDGRNILASDPEPWTKDKDLFIGNSLLFDAVESGLTEEDPATTNWESSKTLLGSGEVASLMVASWGVTQVQQAAEDAGASSDDIGFWPLPVQKDGIFRTVLSGDKNLAINTNSECQGTSREWIDFFVNDSGYAASQGGITPRIGGELPPSLVAFDEVGVEMITMNPEPEGKEGRLGAVQKEAGIALGDSAWYQKLVDVARGAADGDKDSFFAQLNADWSAAVEAQE